MRAGLLFLAASSLLFAACGDDDPAMDASVPRDATSMDRNPPAPDAELPDAGFEPDAEPAPDAESPDAGPTDAGRPDGILVPGLTSSVTVSFDEMGIAHLSCETANDCFAAQGYVHASHRFGQMDLRRRFVRGRLSAIFGFAGEPVLNIDRQSRQFIATRDGARLEERLWDNADADTRAAIIAYTAGINAWISDLRANRNGARITADWPIPASLVGQWTELDSAACMLGLLEDLTNESGGEIAAGELAATVTPEMFFDLYGFLPGSLATILPQISLRDAIPQASPSSLTALAGARTRLSEVRGLLSDALAQLRDRGEPRAAAGLGSNNWFVSPDLAGGNKGLLANDPHLGLENPPIWYVNSLHARDGSIHVAGVSFTGVPGIILGQNAHIAWGATTVVYDMADVYVETLASGGTATMLNGNAVPMVERTEEIVQLGFGSRFETFRYVPHHGPVIAVDAANNTAISVHWVGHDADTDLNFIGAMMRAQDLTQAKAALRNLTSTGQNFIVATRTGPNGWFPYSRVPERPWADQYPPYLPLPGTGEAEWAGFIPYDELPQVESPAYLATANGDISGEMADGDPLDDGPYLQHFVADGFRQQRIEERLTGDSPTFNLDFMQEIQADVFSSIGEAIVPAILVQARTATSASANGLLVIDILDAWDHECPTGLSDLPPDSAYDPDPSIAAASAGCMAFHSVLGRLNDAVFGDEIAAAGATRRARIDSLVVLLTRPQQLMNGEVYWDDARTLHVETSSSVVIRAINNAGDYLVTELGPTHDDWRWGRKHTLTLAAGFVDDVEIGPFANDGGYSTVDVANPSGLYSDDYSHRSGPSMRLACELDETDGVDCTIELPGGQRMFTDSPHYSDLFMRWLRNEPYPLWFEQADVDAQAQETWSIKPE